jgi:hypothetical protein
MRCFDYQPRSRYLQVYKPTRVTGPETMWPFGDIDELTGAGVPRLLTHLMRHAPGAIHLEPERRFHGVVVYPIRVDADEKKGRPRMTYYFDAATYVLRGDRLPGSQPPGLQDIARKVTYLSSRTVVPLRQIPSRAFIFHPPTGRYLIP